MTTAPVLSIYEEQQVAVYGQAVQELLSGRPKTFIENFFWIEAKESHQEVPMTLTPNQEIVHQVLFGDLTSYLTGVEAVLPKDRQATMTSFFQAVTCAYAFVLPGNHAVFVYQDERTGDQLKKRMETFRMRLPGLWFWKHDDEERILTSDRKDYMELEFYDKGKYVGKSSITIVSAGAEEFGRGISPTFVVYDEYDIYRSLNLVSKISDALAPNAWVIKASTPNGMGQLYTDYFAIKEGRAGGKAFALYCFMNPLNRMEEGHMKAPPAFAWDFDLLPEHRRILDSPEWAKDSVFRHSLVDTKEFLRWWEWERQRIRQTLESEGRASEKLVLAYMEQDHCTNDQDCWMGFAVTPFEQEVILSYRKRAQSNLPPIDRELAPDFRLRIWETRQPGMVYACGMDCAEGSKKGDAIAAYIKSADGNYVAALYGRCDLTVATNHILETCRNLYGEALFAPEVDGGWGRFVVEVARSIGYRNIWKEPARAGEDMDKYAIKPDRYGWRTQGNKEMMKEYGIARFNSWSVKIWDIDFIRDASRYDPDSQRHTSDRLMAYFITEMITHYNMKFGSQFARLCADTGGPKARLISQRHSRVRVTNAYKSSSGVWGES